MYRELVGNLKHGDMTTGVANAGVIQVDPNTGRLVLHDGVTPGGNSIISNVSSVSKRNRLAMGFATQLQTMNYAGSYTTFYVMPIPSDAYATRIVLATNITTTWGITSASVCVSDSVSDYINPTGGGAWVPITFQGGGVDSENIVLAGSTRGVTMPTAGVADPLTGSTLVPTFVYSDFVPVQPLQSASVVKFLFIRIFMPTSTDWCRLVFASGGSGTVWCGNTSLNHGFDIAISSTNSDRATTPDVVPTGVISFNQSGPIFSVEYMSSIPGIQISTLGDSQIEGATSVSGFANFVTQSSLALSTAARPIAIRTAAWGGQPSDTWWPMAGKIWASAPPSVAVIQAVSGNDSPGTMPSYMRGFSRSLAAAKKIRDAGGTAIICNLFPRPSWSLSIWQAIRAEVSKLQSSSSGFLYFDPCETIGNKTGGVYDGTFCIGMSDDNLHPNEAGHEAMSVAFKVVLLGIIGN